jgi:hypothetical protein
MGSDFIDRGKRTFAKSWDRARIRLCTSDLFTETPGCAGHSAAFDLLGDLGLKPGDTVVVAKEGCELVARNGLTTVGRAPNPPNDVLRAVEESCGMAKGMIDRLHTAAGVAEISLC